MEGHRPQNRAVIHVLHGEAQGLKRCASPAIGGLNRDAEFTHLSVARTACNRAACGIKQHPAWCLNKAVSQISIVLIGEQIADVFGESDVLLDAELQILCPGFNSDGSVIHLPDGDSKVLHLSLFTTASGQREGMAAHLGLVGSCLENPDGWTAIVKNKQLITLQCHATCWWREGWRQTQIDGCISILSPESQPREECLAALLLAEPQGNALATARQCCSTQTSDLLTALA